MINNTTKNQPNEMKKPKTNSNRIVKELEKTCEI